MTDDKLKQALAKMLPDLAEIRTGEFSGDILYWKQWGLPIQDTELLHVCAMLENELRPIHQERYCRLLREKIGSYDAAISATWQQRATALAKVKGIEV